MKYMTMGFTLVEQLACLAVLGVLSAIALPGLRQFMQAQQVTGATHALHASLLLARSEAVKRNRPVLVDNGDGDWASGWRVYADLNDNGRLDAGEPLIRVTARLSGEVVARGNAPVRRHVRYVGNGRSQLAGGAFQAGTISICHASARQPVRRLVVNAGGRPRLVSDPPGSCAD